MKKLISVLLILAMLAAMIPAAFVATSAEPAATTPTGNWTDEGNYDISWCKTLDSKTSETLEVDGKYYHIMAWTKQTYHITNEKQLAGLAYLSNKASGDLFKGDKFMIDADLDLSAHYWIPISQNSKFRGSLIGNVDGGVATITGMTIDTSAAKNGCIGLIGKFGGDWIENLKLVNAKISAHSFTVGSFVGWQDGNLGSGTGGQGGYRNLSADTQIILTSGESDRFDDVGGIVGLINNCNSSNKAAIINKCVFTGTITAPKADNAGGIVGLSQYDGQLAPVISDCVVISEKMEFGQDFIREEHNSGFGGIAGNLYSNNSGDTVASTVTNCYVAAKMIVLEADNVTDSGKTISNVGGIVGASCSQTKTYTNCQFDGIIVGAATYRRTAGILGRSLDNTTFTNCVVSGIALGMDNSGNLNASRLGGAGAAPTVNNVYTSVKMVNSWANSNVSTQIVADTDLSDLLAQKDADNNAIWVKVEGSLYPILAIAKDYLNDENKHLSVAMSGADLSWFNPSDTGRTKTMTNERELWALEKLLTAAGAKQSDFLTLQKINVKNVLIPMLDELSSDMKTALLAKTVAKTDATKVVNVYAQTSKAVTDGSYAVRFVAEIDGNQWTGAGFDLLVSYTTADGVKMTSKLTEQAVKVCYKSISAGDDSVTAPDGHYFIVFVLDQVPVSNGNMTFTVAAYANGADGAVYGNAGVITFDANGSVVAD